MIAVNSAGQRSHPAPMQTPDPGSLERLRHSPCPAQAGGVDSEVKLYKGKTHTQPLIEDPMSGGRDVLTDEILSVVTPHPTPHPYPDLTPTLPPTSNLTLDLVLSHR